ncbi:hypothetical protein MKW92_035593, partial [Papaver armeniacum]
ILCYVIDIQVLSCLQCTLLLRLCKWVVGTQDWERDGLMLNRCMLGIYREVLLEFCGIEAIENCRDGGNYGVGM